MVLLVKDMRKVMSPHTAGKLRERKDNGVKDYVNLAGSLRVTHLLMFTQTERAVNLKVARMPHGPTLTFQVHTNSSLTERRNVCVLRTVVRSLIMCQKNECGDLRPAISLM